MKNFKLNVNQLSTEMNPQFGENVVNALAQAISIEMLARAEGSCEADQLVRSLASDLQYMSSDNAPDKWATRLAWGNLFGIWDLEGWIKREQAIADAMPIAQKKGHVAKVREYGIALRRCHTIINSIVEIGKAAFGVDENKAFAIMSNIAEIRQSCSKDGTVYAANVSYEFDCTVGDHCSDNPAAYVIFMYNVWSRVNGDLSTVFGSDIESGLVEAVENESEQAEEDVRDVPEGSAAL